MDLQLGVIAQRDTPAHRVHLAVTGVLTEARHQRLHRSIQRTPARDTEVEVQGGLTDLERPEKTAVDLLIRELYHALTDPARPLGFLLPGVLPSPPAWQPAPAAGPYRQGPHRREPHPYGRNRRCPLTPRCAPT